MKYRSSIAVVDDDVFVLGAIAETLEKRGYQVHRFTSSCDALKEILPGNIEVDVVLTDLKMPGSSGLELLERLHASCPDMPVILMTAYADFDAAVAALKQQAFDMIMKPVEFAYLTHLVEKATQYVELLKIKKDHELLLEKIVWEKTIELEEKVAELEKALDARMRAEEEERQMRFERDMLITRLRNLSAHLESVREEERIRISREVHDELGQGMTALQFDLALLKRSEPLPALLVGKIESMEKTVQSTIHSIQRISSDLRPTLLDDLGLREAIEWQARDFAEQTGIRCKTRIGAASFPISMECSTALFRIFREALTNVIRHAGATEVTIDLILQEGAVVVLTVADNGRGMTEQQISAADSFGLMGMRERVLLCNGTIDISGVPGEGSVISVRIPLVRCNI